ncbi:site-specific integrase [Chitinivorax sp. PXF-14]|uniref:site-specific integrase n=1 Tax=Chitinivorax sp. PXF-14 TaxID=3230488 RepID=UPI0034660D8C
MATITKRGDYQWQVKIRRNGYPSQSRTFETKEAAEKWARSVEREMDTGDFLDRREADKNTFAAILKRYQREITPSKKCAPIEAIKIDVLLRDDIAKAKMSALSGVLLAEWRDRRLKAVSSATVNREIDIISAVISQARKEWGVHIDNPVELIRRPPKPKGRERRLVGDEEARLMAALNEAPRRPDGTYGGGTRNPWVKPIVVFAIETAMRRGEILALRWENVDLHRQVAHLPDTKNGDSRDVPLSRRAVETLRAIPRSISGTVFPVTPNALKKGFERAVDRAGMDDFHFHDLRHEAASRLAEKLANVLELSAVTGHRDLRMLKRYYHPRAEDLARKLG